MKKTLIHLCNNLLHNSNNFKFNSFIFSFIFLSFLSCSKQENVIFDNVNGQTALFFEKTSYNLSIPQENLQIKIPVGTTIISSVERTFDAVVNIENTTSGTSDEYTVGKVTIPANEYSGVLSVDFNYSDISGEDGDVKDLVINLVAPENGSAYNNTVSIEYFREIICNDLELTITSDVWATETYFTLERADGSIIVDRFFPFSSNSTRAQTYNVAFNLPDGDYVLKIGDSFGDGQLGTGGGVTLTGNYSLNCSIITHASGEGTFDDAIPDPFPGNTGATVEVTNFTVNP